MDFPALTPFSGANADAALALTNESATAPLKVSGSPTQIEVPAGSLKAVPGDKFRGLPLAPENKAAEPKQTSSVSTTVFGNDKGEGLQVVGSTKHPLDERGSTVEVGARVRNRDGGDNTTTDARVFTRFETRVTSGLTFGAGAYGQLNLPNEGSSGATINVNGDLTFTQTVGSNTKLTGSVGAEHTVTDGVVHDNFIGTGSVTQPVSDDVSVFGKITAEKTLTGAVDSPVSLSAGADIAVSDTGSLKLQGNWGPEGAASSLPSSTHVSEDGGFGAALSYTQKF